jgi:peptidyl-prolyl cis-trans isomerase C
MLLSGPVRAATTPDAPSSSVLMAPAPSSSVLTAPAPTSPTPATPAPDTSSAQQKGNILDHPTAMMNAIADHLDVEPAKIVMQIESETITQGDLAGVIRTLPPGMANLGYQEVFRRALDIMARQKAMAWHARREHLDKDPAVIHDVSLAAERVIADAWLKHQGDAVVTDQALHTRYDSEIAGKPGPDEVHARLILVPTLAEAQTVTQVLQMGADFSEQAREHSKDPTAGMGGDLGYVTRDSMTPEVAVVMFALAPGQTTAYPVPTQVGYFIIKVEGRRTGVTPTFEQARTRLELELRTDAISKAVGSLLSSIKFVTPAHQATPPKP